MMKPHIPRLYKRLMRGECAVYANGRAAFISSDLDENGINGRAVILIDRAAKKMTIRAASTEDHVVFVTRSASGSNATIYLGGALRAMGIDPPKVEGRHAFVAGNSGLTIEFFPGSKRSTTDGR